MPINYNLLQQIPTPQVVANLPPSNSGGGVGELGAGIMQGLQQGTAIAANRQQMAESKQRMDQSAQLFPGQQTLQQQAIQANEIGNKSAKIDLSAKEQAQKDAAVLRAAAKQSKEEYYKTLEKISPGEALTARKLEADIQKTAQETITAKVQSELLQANTKLTTAQTNKVVLEEYDNTMYTLGNVASKALSIQNPQERQKFWAASMSFLPEEYQKKLPQQLDPITGQTLVNIGRMSEANLVAASAGKDKTDVQKNLQRIGQLEGKQGLTPAEQIELKGLKDRQAAASRGAQQLTPAEKVATEVATTSLQEGQKEAGASRNMLAALDSLEQLDKSNKVVSGSFADIQVGGQKGVSALGSIFGINIPTGTAESEAFDAMAKQAQLNYQLLLKGSTSDRDMKVVEKVAPQITNTKEGRQIMYNWGKAQHTAKIQRENFRSDWTASHNGSLSGADDAWDNFISTTSHIDPKTGKFDLDSYKKKAWKPYLDENYSPPKQESSSNSNFVEGKIYQDANGNKAKYVNGKWESL